MTTPLHPKATRRIPLQFDDNGDPVFESVCSPASFTPRANCMIPPRHVIPVIFVPGVMGTNLAGNNKAAKPGAQAWRPPNGIWEGLGEFIRRAFQSPRERQRQLSTSTTKVDSSGPVTIPEGMITITKEEARRRGWGELHWDTYGTILSQLEIALGEQYDHASTPQATPMAVWKLAQTLKRGDADVLNTWNPVKGNTLPLSTGEFERLDDYSYPVWACGYNWLECNEVSAQRLVNKIDEALAWYDQTNYFIPAGKVILLTHSMGGLVARRAAQLAGDKILGVVHSVLPAGGGPVAYRRFRAGTEVAGMFDLEGAVVATIMGWNAADFTCMMANSPGPLGLLPTKHYPKGWLRMERDLGNEKRERLFELPVANPYEEIYSKLVQDVWWGMVDEALIDPADMAKDDDLTPIEAYGKALGQAEDFHDKLGLYCHPNTYAHYGADAKEISFGSVYWTTTAQIPDNLKFGLPDELAAKWTKLGKTEIVNGNNQKITFKLANKRKPESDAYPDAGDGTVPIQSGDLIKENAAHVFMMKGFEHSAAYKDKNVIDNVMYCLGKIIQDATPIKDLPKTKAKGETCTDSATPDNALSEPASQPSPVAAS